MTLKMAADSKVDVKSEKKDESGSSSASANNKQPKDAQVMTAILKDMGVNEFEPKVVNQLLEFSYRYVSEVLDDAKAVSAHAKKKAVDLEDVKLAVSMYAEQNVTSPPSREILLDMARTKNANPLPVPKATSGLRLPPDRHCLTGINYRLKLKSKTGAASRMGPAIIRNAPYAKPTVFNPQAAASAAPVYKISVDPSTLHTMNIKKD